MDQFTDNKKNLVRFTIKQQKSDLITPAKAAKPDDLFVSENLTAARQKIVHALRQAKKKFPSVVSGTYTQNGVPYVWIERTGQATAWPHKIASRAMLISLYTDTLGTPL